MKDYQFKYTVDEARRLIIFRVAGDIPSARLNEEYIAAYRNIPEHWRYNRLVDYRRYTGFLEFTDLEDFAEKIDDLSHDQSRMYKVAIVTSDALEQARISTFRHLFPEDLRAFASMDNALDWLGSGQVSEVVAGRAAG